jgi:archaellum component FlaC
MPSPASNVKTISKLNKTGIVQDIEHIHNSIERLQKRIEALSDQYSPYVESLIDSSFEQGYEQGYNDGAEDVNNAR